ncbi:MAG: TonB-dependent receptor [Mariprofundaceae bacterium]
MKTKLAVLSSLYSAVIAFLFLGCITPLTAEERYSTEKLLGLSMEELMNIKVVSVSKREENYYETAAATFVITNDDIRRSGARSIPEALRLAPGVEVNRVNGNQYAIAIRGQNDLFSDKLLVLMDGRTIYTPTFSGVWWASQNYPLEDIERIEVIRGPSGAIWGANAVNGVINIITKDANKTTGTFITVGGGNEEKGFGTVRFGTDSDTAAYRAYLMTENRDGGVFPLEGEFNTSPTVFPGTQDAPDTRKLSQGGFRIDWAMNDQTDISFHGDLYNVKAGQFGSYLPQPGVSVLPWSAYETETTYKGHNLVLKADSEVSPNTSLSAQLFYDQYKINSIIFNEKRDTFDVDLQLNFSQIPRNLISIGGNYRSSRSDITDTTTVQMADDSMDLTSVFINDEIELIKNRLKLIAGVKMEKNSYMDWQSQPHLRAIYTEDSWGLWAAASKAVRSPNMVDNSLILNKKNVIAQGSGLVASAVGNGSVSPEKVTAYEAGLRFHPDKNLLFQFTVYKYDYSTIADVHLEPANAFPFNGTTIIPSFLKDVLEGQVNGWEADISYRLTEWLKVKGTYSFLDTSYRTVAALTGDSEAESTLISVTKQSPMNRYSIGVSIDPTDDIELDINLYGWSLFRNDGFGPTNPSTGLRRMTSSYNRLDARIAWQATENINITLVGQNMLKAAHREDIDSALEFSSLVQQSYYMKVDYKY